MRRNPGRIDFPLNLILCLLVMSARSVFWKRPLSLVTAWQNSYPIIGRIRPRWNSLHRYTANSADGSDHCLRRIFSNPTAIRTLYGSTVKCWQQQQHNQQSPPIPSAFSSSSWEASEWAVHVAILPQDAPIKATDAIEQALKDYREESKQEGYSKNKPYLYSAAELLELGSAWYLPAEDMGNPYKKPTRLTTTDSDFLLKEKDYLRIHHNPRRFPAVDLYDWSLNSINTQSSPIKNSVVVDHDPDKGYLVLNKPSECIPVHATVDNHAENMVSCLRQANPDLEYVVTPHRLDQNTSGLITLATSKVFAAYYAQVLEHKTASNLPSKNSEKENVSPANLVNTADKDHQGQPSAGSGIHKVYRCLVCLMPPPSTEYQDNSGDAAWSVDGALKKLQLYAKGKTIIRHYLEPSVRAPKRFVATLPPNANTTINSGKTEAGWAECLMRIQSVGDVCALRGNAASDELASALWNSTQEVMPPTCQAVVELEVELLTGRTHQIRGQLSAEGYPLVGDFPYGGCAIAGVADSERSAHHENIYDTRLALQCSQLEFLDPDIRVTHKVKKGHVNEIVKMMPSTRWNEYQLDSAWWTPYLRQYSEAMTKTSQEDMTTLAAMDIGLVETSHRQSTKETSYGPQNPQGLPPQAILSAGRHKYVLVKAIDPNTSSIHKWFVKSASPQECGGPYHRDVAADLVEWIEACGYRAVVTGGGRILYQPETKRALVYGFSYGFGRGDHALAARVIKEWSQGGIDSAYDDSAELY